MFQHSRFAAFQEQASLRFGAGITEQHPSTFRLEPGFGLGDQLQNAIQLFKRLFFAHANIGYQLWKTRQRRASFDNGASVVFIMRRICNAATNPSPVVL